jgi:hypothetical protein
MHDDGRTCNSGTACLITAGQHTTRLAEFLCLCSVATNDDRINRPLTIHLQHEWNCYLNFCYCYHENRTLFLYSTNNNYLHFSKENIYSHFFRIFLYSHCTCMTVFNPEDLIDSKL